MPETGQLHDLSTWDQGRPAAKIKFALQHNLRARKKIIGTSDIFIPCKVEYVDRYPLEFKILQERVNITDIT